MLQWSEGDPPSSLVAVGESPSVARELISMPLFEGLCRSLPESQSVIQACCNGVRATRPRHWLPWASRPHALTVDDRKAHSLKIRVCSGIEIYPAIS